MSVLRTPDERFANLPGYPFKPNYIDVQAKGVPAVRMHYVDAGRSDAPTVLLLHEQPTWTYLYRDLISVLCDAGLRVIAPDHIVFCGDKGIIDADFLIDDRARHFPRFKGRPLLFSAPHNAGERRYPRVGSWKEIRELFAEIRYETA